MLVNRKTCCSKCIRTSSVLASDGWDSDWSTDTEEMIQRIETSGVLPGTHRRTNPALARNVSLDATPKLDIKHFDESLCYAPVKMELCRTLMPCMTQRCHPLLMRGPLFCKRWWYNPLMQTSVSQTTFRTRNPMGMSANIYIDIYFVFWSKWKE